MYYQDRNQQQNSRVALLLENRLLRESLRELLLSRRDFDVVVDTGDRASLVQNYTSSPDVFLDTILVDLQSLIKHSPEPKDGTKVSLGLRPALEELKRCFPNAGVVVLGEDEKDIANVFKAGALGYLTKECSLSGFISAMQSVAQRNIVFPSGAMEALLRLPKRASPEAAYPELTPRERTLLLALSNGMSNKLIASELHLSLRTVQAYVSRLLQKLNLSSRTEAALLAVRSGILEGYSESSPSEPHHRRAEAKGV